MRWSWCLVCLLGVASCSDDEISRTPHSPSGGSGGQGGEPNTGGSGQAGAGGAEDPAEWIIWIEWHTNYGINRPELHVGDLAHDVERELGRANGLSGFSTGRDRYLVRNPTTRIINLDADPISELEVTDTSENRGWWSPSSNLVLLEHWGGSVRAFNVEGGVAGPAETIGPGGTGTGDFDLAFASQQDVVAFMREATDTTLTVVDLRSGVGALQVVATDTDPWSWAWSPTDAVIATTVPTFSLVPVEDGTVAAAEPLQDSAVLDLQWLPDGSSLVYRTADGLRFIDPTETAVPVPVPNTLAVSTTYCASPDSRWIAYCLDEGGDFALHVASRAGATVTTHRIAGGVPAGMGPGLAGWSPDGQRLAWVNLARELFVVDVSGSAPGAPTQLANGVARIAWSPDSTALAYVEEDVGVFVQRIGGSDALITVETIPVDELVSNMKWSPTGRLGYELGGYEGVIKVATLDGDQADVTTIAAGASLQYDW